MSLMEKDYKIQAFKILEPHFEIYQEVRGKHFSGKSMRLDAIVTPKIKEHWKNPNIALGIEFKPKHRLHSDTINYQWLEQCVDYSHSYWDQFGYIFVFVFPNLIDGIRTPITVDEPKRLLTQIMSRLGVGELRFDTNYGLTFFLQGSHRIWSQKQGVESGKTRTLKRGRLGSRKPMNTLEQEIIEKFHQLQPAAKQRVLASIEQNLASENEAGSTFDHVAWFNSVETLRQQIHTNKLPSIDVVGLLRDIRDGEDE